MNIACPQCGYSREVDPSRVPPGATQATCPRCREKFPLPAEQFPKGTTDTRSDEISCSACGLGQPPGERCIGCGATFVTFAAASKPSSYAGFWVRVGAALIDSAAVTVLQFALGVLLSLTVSSLAEFDDVALEFIVGLFGAAVGIVYYVFFTGYGGQTPGKMVLKIKVIRTDGSGLSYLRAFLREVIGKFLSGILLGIGYLMVAFDRKKQGLHDRIADTYVVKI